MSFYFQTNFSLLIFDKLIAYTDPTSLTYSTAVSLAIFKV